MAGSDDFNTVNVCIRVVNATAAQVLSARPCRVYRVKCNTTAGGVVTLTDGDSGRTVFSEIMAAGDSADFDAVAIDLRTSLVVSAIPATSDLSIYTD